MHAKWLFLFVHILQGMIRTFPCVDPIFLMHKLRRFVRKKKIHALFQIAFYMKTYLLNMINGTWNVIASSVLQEWIVFIFFRGHFTNMV